MSESALMLIPLLLTFLSVLQLPVSLLNRVEANIVNSGYADTMQIMANDRRLGVAPDQVQMAAVDGSSSGTGSSGAANNAGSSVGLVVMSAPQDSKIFLGGGGQATYSTIRWKGPSVSPILPSGDWITSQTIVADK